MYQLESFRDRKMPLRGGAGIMPSLGFGTLIPDATETRNATRTALEVGFRHFDCSERYRNEEQVGEAIREAIQTGRINRNDLFITTKLWNKQPPPGASPACDRGQPEQTASREHRPLSDAHSICLSAGRRSGPEGRKR